MMVIHITTLIIYLASMMVYYIFYSVWDENNAKAENKVYISFTASAILLFFVQLVLIYLFNGLSQPATQTESPEQSENNEEGNSDKILTGSDISRNQSK